MVKRARKSAKHPQFILNCIPSKKTEKDWDLYTASTAGAHDTVAAIPARKDLRETWWKIGNQGSTGSCVGWGAADGVLRWHFVKAGKIGKKESESISVRYLWMAAKETDDDTSRPSSFIEDDGTSLKAALDIARKFGVVTNAILPFESDAGAVLYAAGTADDFYAIAAQKRISSYFNLGKNLANWRAWIAKNGPILTRLDVDTAWDNATAANGKLDTYDATQTRGGHCVALVGYTPDYFIVRNSWDTTWGDKGFAYASDKYTAAAFTEAYGITL